MRLHERTVFVRGKVEVEEEKTKKISPENPVGVYGLLRRPPETEVVVQTLKGSGR